MSCASTGAPWLPNAFFERRPVRGTDSGFNDIAAAVVLWYVISGWAYPRISELMSAAG